MLQKIKQNEDAVIRTTFMLGFPGETDKDFEQTLKLIKKVKYDLVFAFMYSKRTGTPAAQMENQVDDKIKNKRVNVLLRQQKIIQKDQLSKYINKTFDCLIKFVNGVAVGLTDGGREIYIPNYQYKNENYFAKVKVEEIRNHKLSGVIV